MTEEENKNYEKLVDANKTKSELIGKLNKEKDAYDNLKISIDKLNTAIVNNLEQLFTEKAKSVMRVDPLNTIFKNVGSKVSAAFIEMVQSIEMHINKLSNEIKILFEELNDVEIKMQPFKSKIKNKEQLDKYSLELRNQTNKHSEFVNKKKESDLIEKTGIENRHELLHNYRELHTKYCEVVNEINKPINNKIGEDLVLISKLAFNNEEFQKSFTNKIDRRTNLREKFYGAFAESNDYIFDEIRHVHNIEMIYDKIKDIEKEYIKTKSGSDAAGLIENLFNDYYSIKYTIEYKGDNILKMSPGKRGLVLLQLILHFSNATHPILIDQPEDNLDNRTIYNELKGFIKDKKSLRQIILVSHNANLVVSTDSENIIIANQGGEQIGKDKKEYLFEYVSGGLECTFNKPTEDGILYKYGVREHVCDILEGGEEAFLKREQKYGIVEKTKK